MMDLRLIEIFVAAARLQSFSAAARNLQVTPAAVSQSIKSLEEQLKMRLFERSTRSVRLTEVGQHYFERVLPALTTLSNAAQALGESQQALAGQIRVTSSTAFGRIHLITALEAFMRLHPDIEIDLSLNDHFADLVADGFDFAVRGGVLPVNEYIARSLLPITRLVCASTAYAKKYGLPEHIEDLTQHHCIALRSNPTQRVFAWEFVRAKQAIKFEIQSRLVLNDPQAAADAAALGMGLAQVGSHIVLPMVAKKRLRTCLESYAAPGRAMYLVYPSRRYVPKRVSVLMDFLLQYFANRDDLRLQA